jgi:thiol:disulfide interchange protein DsbD
MTRIKAIFGAVMIIMAVYYALPLLPKSWNPLSAPKEQSSTPWQEYSEETFAKAIDLGKPVIVDFYADWCVACKELEAYTFTDPAVRELGKDFIWVQYDATTPSAEFEAIKKKYKIIGLPNVIFINSKGEWMEDLTLTGFEKAEPFLKRMKKAIQ